MFHDLSVNVDQVSVKSPEMLTPYERAIQDEVIDPATFVPESGAAMEPEPVGYVSELPLDLPLASGNDAVSTSVQQDGRSYAEVVRSSSNRSRSVSNPNPQMQHIQQKYQNVVNPVRERSNTNPDHQYASVVEMNYRQPPRTNSRERHHWNRGGRRVH